MMKAVRVAGIALISAALIMTPAVANAADGPRNDPRKIAMQIPASHSKIVINTTATMAQAKSSFQPMASSQGTKNKTLTGGGKRTVTPSGGKAGTLAASFTSHSTWNWLGTSVTVTGGSSKAQWLGATPYNADSITLTDKLWVASLGNVTIGYPSGIGATVTGTSWKLSSTAKKNWQLSHGFGGVTFQGPLFNLAENVTVAATFKTSHFTYSFD